MCFLLAMLMMIVFLSVQNYQLSDKNIRLNYEHERLMKHVSAGVCVKCQHNMSSVTTGGAVEPTI